MTTAVCFALTEDDAPGYGHQSNEFEESLEAALEQYPSAPDRDNPAAWEYVQLIPLDSWRGSWYMGNDGTQAWRHRKTGLTIPDYCRQTNGCPEIWNRANMEGRKQLTIAPHSPALDYLVIH
jgi:hypothetical protein